MRWCWWRRAAAPSRTEPRSLAPSGRASARAATLFAWRWPDRGAENRVTPRWRSGGEARRTATPCRVARGLASPAVVRPARHDRWPRVSLPVYCARPPPYPPAFSCRVAPARAGTGTQANGQLRTPRVLIQGTSAHRYPPPGSTRAGGAASPPGTGAEAAAPMRARPPPHPPPRRSRDVRAAAWRGRPRPPDPRPCGGARSAATPRRRSRGGCAAPRGCRACPP